ncbi:HAD family hydrolase [Streptomyces zagrosensis]|uniref:Phosphoglycolate phosphatase-like HAD superfamily hydrolase n=1 Tax=Streptomyces zagrosensis TaxID=1042984 RepID=A0A7W9UZX5_9ACTN|nr:haloacid dehalogenase-like hydrolase [Streptomyces zagrosensis]MBB5937232.1 phosphoglycolate phosphatase-like HAD superfamily hydrolase [Streptomyces zagrosensis]
MILVLWDIDRTLLYVGDTDRLVYREVFRDTVGREATKLPARGTGLTMPLAVRELLLTNDVPFTDVDALTKHIVQQLPDRLAHHHQALSANGHLMPGAVQALSAVRGAPHLIPSIVTGNLKASAEIKLTAFGLDAFVEIALGGYASDDPHRPHLVSIAQQRATAAYRRAFDRRNTVIVGDSLQDVSTGREGGAHVIGVASGTTSREALIEAGADHVIPDLTDTRRLLKLIAETGNHTSPCITPTGWQQ